MLQPWYAKLQSDAAGKTSARTQSGAGGGGSLVQHMEGSPMASEPKKHKDKKEKHRHKEKKSKDKKMTRLEAAGVSKQGKNLFAALREEREVRETAERTRARQAVLDATMNAHG
jgi:hypothetical protein